MNIYYEDLTIRNASSSDAKQLQKWWNDGSVMSHAGFPDGLNETIEGIRDSLATDCDEKHRRHIIELSGKAIGEMNYVNKGDSTAQIGIKICEAEFQNRGYGTILLTLFIDALFRYLNFDRVILDTNIKNTRAQHVYETKLYFKRVRVRENSWQNQHSIWQSFIDYELTKTDWLDYLLQGKITTLRYIYIRNEQPSDYSIVEQLTRNAFWENSHHHCDEHLLVNRIRQSDVYIPELDFVALVDLKIVGHILYTKSHITDNEHRQYEMLTFGPLSVLPNYQYTGIGSALLNHSIGEARRLQYSAILIFGHPDYYPRFGFIPASEYGISDAEGNNYDPFMALPLYPGALDDISGRYYIGDVFYQLNEEDVLAFDKQFEAKQQYIPIPIKCLIERLEHPDAKSAIMTLKVEYLDDMKRISQKEVESLHCIAATDIVTIKTAMAEHNLRWGR
ncbi:MAG: GNAT family N-acetyltransferase [Oscillospiraceae bacterium]|nr:GNAT family N-acetyltransferase [Oscillospiraceae bacterium]